MKNIPFGELFSDAKASVRSLSQGEMLFTAGDPATHIFAVLEGCVRMVRYSPAGDPVSMHTARPGDSLAEASLFSDTYHCAAEALLPSTVACYGKEKILAILNGSTEEGVAFISLLCRHVRSLRAIAEVRSIRNASDRVMHYLLLNSDPRTMKVELAGSLKDMANELTLTHETLYRTLAKLEKTGMIARSAGVIKILR